MKQSMELQKPEICDQNKNPYDTMVDAVLEGGVKQYVKVRDQYLQSDDCDIDEPEKLDKNLRIKEAIGQRLAAAVPFNINQMEMQQYQNEVQGWIDAGVITREQARAMPEVANRFAAFINIVGIYNSHILSGLLQNFVSEQELKKAILKTEVVKNYLLNGVEQGAFFNELINRVNFLKRTFGFSSKYEDFTDEAKNAFIKKVHDINDIDLLVDEAEALNDAGIMSFAEFGELPGVKEIFRKKLTRSTWHPDNLNRVIEKLTKNGFITDSDLASWGIRK